MNKVFSLLTPREVFYSDTDSIYILFSAYERIQKNHPELVGETKEKLKQLFPDYFTTLQNETYEHEKERKMKIFIDNLSSFGENLCQFKNDYGDKFISNATFLDVKRCLMKFTDGTNKLKFLGVNFIDFQRNLFENETQKDDGIPVEMFKKLQS